MNFQEEVNKVKEGLKGAEQILVAINKTPSLDSVASSLALYLGLKKLGKKASVFCEDKIKVEFGNLIAVDRITDKLGGRNFVISLDYKEGSINKVSYNIEGDRFNLVIESRPGVPQLTPENVHYSYSDAAADLIFVVDAPTLSDLGRIYEEKREIFLQEKIVNIDHSEQNENFGRINLVVPQAASTSEIVTLLLRNLDIKIDQDIATNLLAGVTFGSNNFSSPKTNATTFEAAALCLRAGGKRVSFPQPVPKKKPPVFIKEEKKKEEKRPSFAASSAKPLVTPGKASEGKEEKAPPDWLKPKIYKGSTLL